MAKRCQPLIWVSLATLVCGGIITLTIVLAGLGLWQAGHRGDWSRLADPYLWHVVWFSFYEALLSAVLSLIVGVGLGRCLFYLKPVGEPYWLSLASVCFVAPVILVVLGVVGAFGHTGIWATILGFHGYIYGLSGILIAHLFLNIPLFMRHSYLLWLSIAPFQWQQAEQMGLSSWQRWRYLEWPLLQSGLLSSFLLVFLLCFGSFTIVLALGGGPANTTFEVAIYQALRYDFDPGFALLCALGQLTIAVALSMILKRVENAVPATFGHRYKPVTQVWERVLMRAGLLMAAVFFGSVIIGMASPLWPISTTYFAWNKLFEATVTSFIIAAVSWLLSALLLLGLVILLIYSWHHSGWRWLKIWVELWSSSMLYLPAMVISTGVFFWLWQKGWQVNSMGLIALINAMMALPFTMRILRPALWRLEHHYHHLLQEINLDKATLIKTVYIPVLAKPLALASAFALVLSLGDMGVIAMLGQVGLVTLPLLVYQQLGHYQYAAASATGLWLLVFCLGIFMLTSWLAKKVEHVRG